MDDHPSALDELGLTVGTRVRFRRRAGERWKPATLVGMERDGSLALRDGKGAARAIPVELVEVEATGPRGAATWEPATERVARGRQLDLL